MVIALYLGYLAVCTGVTIAVGAALGRSGRVVMTGLLGDERLADAVSRLLVVTLYLLNFGYVALTLGASGHVATARQAIGVLSVKLGEELLVLGSLHVASLVVFARLRRRQRPPAGQSGSAPPWAAPRQRTGAGARAS
ncbi:MAG: hypothetical protein ACRDOK_20060 [Streptosporangiaceae bacterium]